MRSRFGYVSNSSSSSFLLAYDDLGQFDCVKKTRGYGSLLPLLERGNASEEEMVSFMEDYVGDCIYEYADSEWHNPRMAKDHGWLARRYEWSLVEHLMKCGLDKSYAPVVKELEDAIGRHVREIDHPTYDYELDRFDDMERMLALVMVDCLMKRHSRFAVVEFSDEDDFGSYLEHEFMPGLMSYSEERGFLGASVSHH